MSLLNEGIKHGISPAGSHQIGQLLRLAVQGQNVDTALDSVLTIAGWSPDVREQCLGRLHEAVAERKAGVVKPAAAKSAPPKPAASPADTTRPVDPLVASMIRYEDSHRWWR
jgi:hypothetical protein